MYIFLLAFMAAVLEFFIASELAHSTAAIADAIHAFVHSILYAITAYTEYLFLKMNYTPEKRQKFGLILGLTIYAPLILLGLGYVVIVEALPRFLHPTAVESRYMIASGGLGFIANLLAWLGLREIKRSHGAEDARHSLLSWDAVEDLSISLAVLFGGIAILTTGVYRIDSILTFGAASWIAWQVYRILKDEIRALI